VPLALGLSSVMATIGLVSLESQLVPMDQNVGAVLLLIGLAVGVDYSLFYLVASARDEPGDTRKTPPWRRPRPPLDAPC